MLVHCRTPSHLEMRVGDLGQEPLLTQPGGSGSDCIFPHKAEGNQVDEYSKLNGAGAQYLREQDVSDYSIVLYQIPEPAPIAKTRRAEMMFTP